MKLAAVVSLSLLALSGMHHTAYAADKYHLDPNHMNIVWQANHFGFSSPSGKFAKVQGDLLLDEANPENSQVTVTIRTDSIITGLAKFDEHLKSRDFLDASKYPVSRFVSTKIVKNADNTAEITGDLTLRGITRTVVLNARLNKIGDNPMTKKRTAGFSATATIRRSDFGMNYAIPGVSDEVALMIEAEAIKEGKTVGAVGEDSHSESQNLDKKSSGDGNKDQPDEKSELINVIDKQ